MQRTELTARVESEGGSSRDLRDPRTGVTEFLMEWLRLAFRNGIANMGKSRGKRRMKLIETLALGGKRQLMLVECEGRRILVGAGGDSVHSIAELQSSVGFESGLDSLEDATTRYEERRAQCS